MARIEVRERMAALLKQWGASGESAAAFCRRHRINPQKLSYWKRALGRERPQRQARRREVAGFAPVQLVGADMSPAVGAVEIHFAGGERIVFPPGGSLEVLREVVALLRERC